MASHDKEAQEAITNYKRLTTVEYPYPLGKYDGVRYSLVLHASELEFFHPYKKEMITIKSKYSDIFEMIFPLKSII